MRNKDDIDLFSVTKNDVKIKRGIERWKRKTN